MRRPARVPAPRVLVRSTAAVLIAAVPVGVAWWTVEGTTALAVYLGMTFMVVAATRLPLARQLVVAASAGVASGLGSVLGGHTLLLIVAAVLACLSQWKFNQWSVAAAALLPAVLVKYSVLAPDVPLRVALATWSGAGIAMVVAALARLRIEEPQPATAGDAARHAVKLALGCVLLILLMTVVELPKGSWAVLTLCLLFLPEAGETRVRVRNRVLGTVAGAMAAVVVAVTAPEPVSLALAVICAVLTVAYALMADNLLYVVFLTPTVLLLFGTGQSVLGLAAHRVGMTMVGGLLAALLTVLTLRSMPRPWTSMRAGHRRIR